jgi:hypothetical protein
MRTLTAIVLFCVFTASGAQAHTYHRHYAPIRHIDAPINRGWLDVGAIPAYSYPSRERSWAAVSVASGRHSARTHIRYAERAVYSRGEGLSAPCRQAARMGGPCGCHTAETLLGTSEHVYHGINVWLADGWLAFRRVSHPEPGDAAIWVHRHVAPIVAVDGNTVTVADYFGTRTVRMAGLVFVDPRSR